MNVTGLSQSDGVRLKIEVENGSVQRLLLGLSNCTSGITREDYAMLISPDVVDEEGYINIPFSYFVNAHWASQKFTKSELEQVIVFIVEAYGVTKDTEITLSDLRGYQLTGASVDKTKLASVIAAVEALDTDKYDAEIAAAKAIYNDSFATQAEVDAQVKILNTCLDNFNNPPVNGYTYVQLNGVQNWTAEDVARLHKYGASFAISDKGLIGKATQSIELTVTDNKMRYCLSSNVDNPSGFLEKNAFSFVNAEAGYKLSDFDGIAIAFADADGNEIPISTFQPRLMRSSSDWNNFTAYQVSYSDIKAIYKNGYYHLKFSDFKNLPGDAINDICIPSILFYTGLNAGEKAYISDFCAYRYDESAAPVEQKTKREYVQLDGVQKWTANEIASLENFGASFALSDKGLIGNATQSVELTVTSAPSEKQRFCMASKTTSNGFLAKSPFAFTDTTAGYKLSDFDGIAIAFSDADGKELPITQFQCRLMRGSNDWSNYQAVEANYFDIPAVYKDGYYHLRFRDYTHLAGAIDDVYILSVLFYKSIKVGDKAYISDMLAYRDVPDLDDIVADLWEYNYTADSWTAYSEAAAVATTAAEAEAAVALLVPRKTVAVTENFFKGWTNKMVNDVVEANTHRLCDSIGDGLNRKDVWNDGDFSNNTTFDAGDGWFSMTTTVDLLNGSIGWKNMDRNKVYQPADNGAYPALTVAGLSKAEGLRLKLEVTGKAERLLIGLSNCSKFVREQYALKIKPEYVDADGYINIPFTYFEKAWWCDAFAQAELEDVIVFIVEAYGVEKDTTIKLSDVHGYKELIPATDADFEALNAAVNALKAIDLDGNKFADLYALAEGVANSNDHEEVAPVTAQLNAKLAELGDADRAPVKAKIAELDALDETDYFADERASFKQRYYGALDAEGVAALIADIQACIDQFSVPEAPEAPTAAVVEPTRVVLNTIEGAENKCGDGEWQK
ncbi:MAG: hypothetical protein IKZ81_04965, partial [Clostridia bacterium]|nr:hypothetical protein [Clostridia bacterium]